MILRNRVVPGGFLHRIKVAGAHSATASQHTVAKPLAGERLLGKGRSPTRPRRTRPTPNLHPLPARHQGHLRPPPEGQQPYCLRQSLLQPRQAKVSAPHSGLYRCEPTTQQQPAVRLRGPLQEGQPNRRSSRRNPKRVAGSKSSTSTPAAASSRRLKSSALPTSPGKVERPSHLRCPDEMMHRQRKKGVLIVSTDRNRRSHDAPEPAP